MCRPWEYASQIGPVSAQRFMAALKLSNATPVRIDPSSKYTAAATVSDASGQRRLI